MLTQRKLFRTFSAIMPAILLLVATTAAAANSSAERSEQRIVVTIDGLACPYCAYGLRKHLLTIPGVAGVKVSPEQSEAVIEVAPGSSVNDAEIRNAIASAHFSGGEISYQ
jgi:mercuric ion binding protein